MPRAIADIAANGQPRVRNGVRQGQVQIDADMPAAACSSAEPLTLTNPDTRIYLGDCRKVLGALPEVKNGEVDLVFADPPFNWGRAYDAWDDGMHREDYLDFTREWITMCVNALKPTGSIWINIPDDTAAEIVMILKGLNLHMVNWCIWHYRFGQNRTSAFVSSKVHALYFSKDPLKRTWNPQPVLEPSDRATTYFDPRTLSKKDGMPAGMRVPLDVWYGSGWGRVQGNNKERRHYHDNQLPEAYLERVVLCSSNEGDLVMDPFVGSGTTAVMARHYQRRFIGSEFSPVTAKSAFERIKAGPINAGKALGQATAIFSPRGTGKKTKARFGKTNSESS